VGAEEAGAACHKDALAAETAVHVRKSFGRLS
jgi:hypothetical protein